MKGDNYSFNERKSADCDLKSNNTHKLRNMEEIKQQIKMNYIVIILCGLSQGVQSLSDLALSYFYKDDLNLHPYEVSRIASIVSIPWIIKPVYGFISDSFPIFGFRRKPYLIIMAILVSICWTMMGLYVTTINQTIFFLIISSTATAFYNVIGEALVVELSQKQKEFDPDAGAKNVSLFFMIRSCGNLFSACFIGPLLQIMDKRSSKLS